jgi:hypothetical protein
MKETRPEVSGQMKENIRKISGSGGIGEPRTTHPCEAHNYSTTAA